MRTAPHPKVSNVHLAYRLKKMHDILDAVYGALDEEDYDYVAGRVDKTMKEIHMLRKKLIE